MELSKYDDVHIICLHSIKTRVGFTDMDFALLALSASTNGRAYLATVEEQFAKTMLIC